MAYITSDLGPPKGFHPTSKSTIHLPNPLSTYNSCTLHLYYTLPPQLFVDTHELGQREESYTFKHWGSRDLEKPVHALPDEISELLLDVRSLEGVKDGEEGTIVVIEVPMHLRYGKPRAPVNAEEEKIGPYEEVHVDWPKAFLRCSSSSQDASSNHPSISLPERVLSALSTSDPGKDQVLIPIPPHTDFAESHSTLLLPLGNPKDLAAVEGTTVVIILLCFVLLIRASWRTATRLAKNTPRPKMA